MRSSQEKPNLLAELMKTMTEQQRRDYIRWPSRKIGDEGAKTWRDAAKSWRDVAEDGGATIQHGVSGDYLSPFFDVNADPEPDPFDWRVAHEGHADDPGPSELPPEIDPIDAQAAELVQLKATVAQLTERIKVLEEGFMGMSELVDNEDVLATLLAKKWATRWGTSKKDPPDKSPPW